MSFYVYIIQSEVNGSSYTGYSADPEKRLAKHNMAKSGCTSRLQPWRLVYMESYPSKKEALKRERFLKRQRNRDFYLKLINKHHSS